VNTGPLRQVTIKALGLLSRRLPEGGLLCLPLPEAGDLQVREAMRLAGLPDEEVFLVVVNGKRATPDRILAPGDEVTFVPPVAGG
jgi:sulfur carrier protein ThiS